MVALLVFVAVGLVTHHGDVSAVDYVRDALALAGCWLLAAGTFDLYRHPRPRAFAATWLTGITAGVLVRALLRLHLDGGDGVFLLVALCFTLAFVVAARLSVSLVRT